MAGDRVERSGRFVVDGDYDDVFDRLADPAAVASCIPDEAGQIRPAGDDRVTVAVAVGVGAIRPRLEMTVVRERADRDAGVISYTAAGEGSRSHVDAAGRFELSDTGDGVEVSWEGSTAFGGLLASLGVNVGRIETIAADKLEVATENVRSLL